MINIVLNKINLDPLDIVESLEQYDLNILSENICDLKKKKKKKLFYNQINNV